MSMYAVIMKYEVEIVMKSKKIEKSIRILDMYVRLRAGKCLNKRREAEYFHVDARSVQRDIDILRCFLAEQQVYADSGGCTIVYDKRQNGYIMQGMEETMLTNSEILAVSKILLASRAFSARGINGILDKLLWGCVSSQSHKLVQELLANEKFHYVEVADRSEMEDRLWELGCVIQQKNLLEITYFSIY